jgi:uncharacterized protein (DUF4213/DUF364 family)
MASTVVGEKPHAHDYVRDVGNLLAKSARELAEFARSDVTLEASIGLAALNSLLDVDEAQAVQVNAVEVMIEYGRAKNIALVGHFPFIPRLMQAAGQLWVIEQHPIEGEYPVEVAADLIPRADVVALTGSALINHTLDGLLALCSPDALVMVLGPTTPLSPVWFNHGVIFVSGTRVFDEAAVIRTVSQGANFQQVEGTRLLTMTKPGFRQQR